MDNISLEQGSSTKNECNICYDNGNDESNIIKLSCCKNSKQICVKCINCLTTPLCPYCRKKLDKKCLAYLQIDKNISRSEPINSSYNIEMYQNPYSFEEFLSEEQIINPYLYENSRRLRRQMRRLRHEYSQRRSITQNININNTNLNRNQSSRQNRNQGRRNRRHYLVNESRMMTQLYNQHETSLDDELMFHIEV